MKPKRLSGTMFSSKQIFPSILPPLQRKRKSIHGVSKADGTSTLGKIFNTIRIKEEPKTFQKITMEKISRLCAILIKPKTGNRGFEDGKIIPEMSLDEYEAVLKTMSPASIYGHNLEVFNLLKQYHNLLTVTSSVSVETDTGEAIVGLIEGTYRIIDVERVALFLVDHNKRMLKMCVSKDAKGENVRFGKGIVGHVARSGETIIVPDAYNDPRFDPQIDISTGFITQNILCVPIFNSNKKTVAVLQCINKPTPFNGLDKALIELLAMIVGHSMHKLDLYEAAMLAGRKSSAMLEIVRAVSTEDIDVKSVIHKIIKVATAALSSDRVTLYLCDTVKKELLCCVSEDFKEYDGFRLKYGVGIAGLVAQKGNDIRIEDCYRDERFNRSIDLQSGYTTVSMLAMPVKSADGEVIAVLQAINKKVKNSKKFVAFSDDDVYLMQAFVEEIASSLKRTALESVYHKILQNVNTMKRRDSSVLVISSLLGHHSRKHDNAKNNQTSSKNITNYSLIFRILGKFSRRVKAIRGTNTITSGGKISELLIQDKITVNWQEDKYSFKEFHFNIFTIATDTAITLVHEAFHQIGLVNRFSIDSDKLLCFLNTVKENYNQNPYHSWTHAVGVFQQEFAMLNYTNLTDLLKPLEILALMVGTICHDINHPGHDNSFEIATSSDLAMLYNDNSVLEQHHAAETFRILRTESCNIAEQFSKLAFQDFRKNVVDGILQTDMKYHFDLVCGLTDRVEKRGKTIPIFDPNSTKDKKLLIGSILHSCDIGTQMCTVEVAGEWSRRLMTEFKNQSLLEEELDIPVAAFRKNLDDPTTMARLQLDFIDYIVSPIWTLIMKIFPGTQSLKHNLECNRKMYQQLLANSGSRNS